MDYIHLRVEEIFGDSPNSFGATNILFVGDILQLPPVNGQPVFVKLQNKSIPNRLGCMTTINIWKDTVIYDELTINESQKNDIQFTKILEEVHHGCPSKEKSINHLKQRVIKETLSVRFKEIYEISGVPVCLFPTREACDKFNLEMLN